MKSTVQDEISAIWNKLNFSRLFGNVIFWVLQHQGQVSSFESVIYSPKEIPFKLTKFPRKDVSPIAFLIIYI